MEQERDGMREETLSKRNAHGAISKTLSVCATTALRGSQHWPVPIGYCSSVYLWSPAATSCFNTSHPGRLDDRQADI